jgi:hypothetical protein
VTGLALAWVAARGAVRFTLTNPTAKQTVMRVAPGGVLQQIRGYPTDTWWAGTTQAFGYDYEQPLGVTVTYAVVPYTARTLPAGAVTAAIFTRTPGATNGEAWLRDPLQPILSVPTYFVSAGDEARTARQSVLEIAGRSNAYVVWDTRAGRSGTLQLAVANDPTPGVWSAPTNRDQLEALFMSGRPLLLSVCDQVGFRPCYMACGNVSFARIAKLPRWVVSIDYDEVDNPLSDDIVIAPEVTYEVAQGIPPNATYADWTSVTYYEIATRRTL